MNNFVTLKIALAYHSSENFLAVEYWGELKYFDAVLPNAVSLWTVQLHGLWNQVWNLNFSSFGLAAWSLFKRAMYMFFTLVKWTFNFAVIYSNPFEAQIRTSAVISINMPAFIL